MTEREKLIELLKAGGKLAVEENHKYIQEFVKNHGRYNSKTDNNAPFEEIVADYLLENGVILVDTNSVKRESLPLIQQAFNMPLDELAQFVEAKQAGRIAERPCKVFDKTFLLLESDSGEYEIYESKCVRITDNGYGVYYSMAYKCPAIGNTLELGISDFGKAVFLTREEAEKALAERNGENDGR